MHVWVDMIAVREQSPYHRDIDFGGAKAKGVWPFGWGRCCCCCFGPRDLVGWLSFDPNKDLHYLTIVPQGPYPC